MLFDFEVQNNNSIIQKNSFLNFIKKKLYLFSFLI